MATRLPNALPRRPTTSTLTHHASISIPTAKPSHTPLSHTPSRAATLIRRPRRPYSFTQLVQQTDGSTYTQRTTSPIGLYKSTKDSRNHILWQPNDRSLKNVEVDEAGKLAAFRNKFGRGWDAERTVSAEEEAEVKGEEGKKGDAEAKTRDAQSAGYDALSDLISTYSASQKPPRKAKQLRKKLAPAAGKKK
ncbi:uncharacterized protein F4822DRAFT_153059 [Hypoxylon trugodes]|uniref:uncharacterized protein n=1 Tax=Hypoxylon trugodes TaxID=326681 RepID=UPI00219EF9E3|nr:uncharacterized protein F4822DRAFT_153059 [Hypoxylon trugodes]KAI1390521.1 hypothetical protein F4822DRAFT_153059 [Hypoxylon trugodes]